jgi:putative cell wall-binding protein
MPCRHAPSFVLRLATVAIATLTSLALVATMASAAAPVDRLAGADRVETSVSVARAGWDQSDHVLLATAVDYPDAVAAAALASTLEAPVLLTMPDGLSDAVASAITDLDASTVTLLGGGAALSTRVAKDVRELGVDVRRIAGSNRYETAAKIAREVADQSDVSRVAIALGNRTDGRGAWPDALSAASLTGGDRTVPTLLTTRGELPDETRATLKELAPDMAMVLGGEGAVSDQVTTTVADLVSEVSRLRGPTRYDTAIEVAEASMANAGSSHAVFVSGEDFADALSGGALAARLDAPLLLVPGSLLDDEVDAFLRSDAAAVTDHVETELVAAMTGEPRPAPPCPENSSPDCTYTYRHAISTWERLAQCESGGNWAINTGNGYYGGLQFNLETWRSYGGSGYPHENSREEQIRIATKVRDANGGYGAWPACSQELGLPQ